MKIQGNKPPEGQEVGLNARKVSTPEVKDKTSLSSTAKAKPLSDRVDISGKGKEIADLMAAVNKLPDIRNDKVQAIKEAIESGTYSVDSKKIAAKLLEEI